MQNYWYYTVFIALSLINGVLSNTLQGLGGFLTWMIMNQAIPMLNTTLYLFTKTVTATVHKQHQQDTDDYTQTAGLFNYGIIWPYADGYEGGKRRASSLFYSFSTIFCKKTLSIIISYTDQFFSVFLRHQQQTCTWENQVIFKFWPTEDLLTLTV